MLAIICTADSRVYTLNSWTAAQTRVQIPPSNKNASIRTSRERPKSVLPVRLKISMGDVFSRKFWLFRQKNGSHGWSGTSQHNSTSQLRSLIPKKNIWNHDRKRNPQFGMLHQLSMKRFFEQVKIRQGAITDTHTRKLVMSIMSFQVTPFCCLMLRCAVMLSTESKTDFSYSFCRGKMSNSVSFSVTKRLPI